MVIFTAVMQLALLFPVACVASVLHSVWHPADDWTDIVGFGAGLTHVLFLPPLLAVVWILGRRFEAAREKRHAWRCVTCGYDLTGTARCVCPECGSAESKCNTSERRRGAHNENI
jgi:hypothetical protein